MKKEFLLSLNDIDEGYLEDARPKVKKKTALPRLVIAASLLLVGATVLTFALLGGKGGNDPIVPTPDDSTGTLIPPEDDTPSYAPNPRLMASIKNYIKDSSSNVNVQLDLDMEGSAPDNPDESNPNGSYVEVTDNQVSGLVEGDLLKATDKYLFRLGAHTLYIYSINGEESEEISQMNIPYLGDSARNDYNKKMFLSDDGRTITLFLPIASNDIHSKTGIISIDVSDITSPKEINHAIVNAEMMDVRRIEDKFYLVSYCAFLQNTIDLDNPASFIPTIDFKSGKHYCDGDSIVFSEKITSLKYQYITVFNEGDLSLSAEKSLLNIVGQVFFTEEHILFNTEYYKSEPTDDAFVSRCYSEIGILKREDGELSWRGSITVEGWTKDQYSFDERDGKLRIVTSVSDRASYSTVYDSASLYVYDLETLTEVASVEEFAPYGEGATAVRFEGDKLYVCTANVIEFLDPVYFFDLSDYSNITYTHTGFIDGFSSSLIDLGEGYLLGVGREDARTGKLEVYVREGDSVVSVDKYLFIGNPSEEYKSYIIDRENNLFGIAVNNLVDGDKTKNVAFLIIHFDGERLRLIASPETSYTASSYYRGLSLDGFIYITTPNHLFVTNKNGSSVNIATHSHSFGNWQDASPIACGETGEQIRQCSCGRTETKAKTVNHKIKDDICTTCGITVDTAKLNLDNIIFTSNDDGSCVVTGFRGPIKGRLVIPELSPRGDTVIAIGNYAFMYTSGKTEIVLPETVKRIGAYAFYYDSYLESVIAPGIEAIGSYAFYNCSIDTFIFPDGLKSIGDSAFSYTNISKAILPDSLVEIGDSAFERAKVTQVKLPANLNVISAGLFNGCDMLSEVILPNNLTKIEQYAFNFCNSLVLIEIPDSVTSIGKRAFGNCSKMVGITLGTGVREINDDAFVDCVALSEVINRSTLNIEAGSDSHGKVAYYATNVSSGNSNIKKVGNFFFFITDNKTTLVAYVGNSEHLHLPKSPVGGEYEIGNNVFYFNNKLKTVSIPEGVTAIGDEAFYWCSNLTGVSLPNSLISIGDRAFAATQVIEIIMGDNVEAIGDYTFNGCTQLQKIRLSEGLKTIGDCAFRFCRSLTYIEVPKSVEKIGDNAFDGCGEVVYK